MKATLARPTKTARDKVDHYDYLARLKAAVAAWIQQTPELDGTRWPSTGKV